MRGRDRVRVVRFIAEPWLRELERARAAFGVRSSTIHVTEGEWLEHWRAGMDPVSAVISESSQADC